MLEPQVSILCKTPSAQNNNQRYNREVDEVIVYKTLHKKWSIFKKVHYLLELQNWCCTEMLDFKDSWKFICGSLPFNLWDDAVSDGKFTLAFHLISFVLFLGRFFDPAFSALFINQ